MATKGTSLRPCIEDRSSKNIDYKYPEQAIDQAELLKSASTDLYSDHIRFIYELIQNADDAKSIKITLSLLQDKYLIIAHDGKAFDERDLQGLCSVCHGTKKKDLDKTGYKGLGFKAVFGKSDKVIIYSNGEYFRFDSSYQIEWNKQWGTDDQQTWEKENDRKFIYPWQINPIWTTKDEIPNFIINFLDSKQEQIHVAYIILLNDIEEICLAIDQLKQQPYMFLFLRNISQMTFSTKTTAIVSINRDTNSGLKKVSVNNKMVSQWIIKRAELDVPNDIQEKLSADTKVPEKLCLLKKAEIFFAAKYKDPIIDENGKVISEGGIEKLSDQESVLFSYLPTKILEYKFPVLINANFLTTANREQIHMDSAWNQWLFEKIGSEIFQWIAELVTNENIRFQAYRLIPSTLNLTNNVFSTLFNESMRIALKNSNFIINRTNQFLRIDEVIMDLTTLSKQSSFINIDSMRQYVINNYKDSHFQCAEYPFIDFDPNLSRIGVRQFTWNNCIQMFNSEQFIKTHSIEQNKKMIEYFYSKYSIFEKKINMQQIPFLIDHNNRLQLTKNIYFPAETIGDYGTTDSNDLFVNKIIFDWLNENTQKEIKQWLQNLGVVERTDLTYLNRTMIPNASNYITLENALKIIKILFRLFQEGKIGKNELNQLKSLKLLTTRGTLASAERCYFSNQYKPRLPFEDYLKTKEEKFISFDYVTNDICQIENEDLVEWRRFFGMLGVQEELYVVQFQQKLLNNVAAEYGFHQSYLSQWSCRGHPVEAYSGLKTIMFLQHTKNDYDFSKFFWSHVLKNIKAKELKQDTKIYWGYHNLPGWTDGSSVSIIDYVVWFVKNVKCMPTTLNTCESSSNIFIDTEEIKELCNQYMPFSAISLSEDKSDWNDIFAFKTKLLLNDYCDLLEKIRHDETNLNNNLNRIQMIYSHILHNINTWSVNELQIRVQSLYLLSENNQWKLSSDLFIYMEGNGTNNNINDGIPCVKLDFKNRTHKYLNKFLGLFKIKQIRINDLKLDIKQPFPAEKFERKLNEILPYLKNWLIKLLFPIDIISLIDKIIQQEIQFIESDCLQLFYNGKLIEETNVYFDSIQKQFYLTRPWNSETTFIDLPNKLCQLLNIQRFEDKLRYLLKAEIEEIKKYFTKLSIEIPTNIDSLSERLSQLGIVKRPIDFTSLPSVSNESSCIKDRDTKIDDLQAMKISTCNPENQMFTTGPVPDINCGRYEDASRCVHQTSTQSSIKKLNLAFDKRKRSSSANPVKSVTKDLKNINLKDRTEENAGLNQNMDLNEEQVVYKYLQKKYSSPTDSISIKWENEYGESHLPYDILLIDNEKKHYIEVKKIRSINKHTFSISMNQINALLEYNENYSIYLVVLEENKLIIFNNVEQCLKERKLNSYLVYKPSSLDQIYSLDN